MMIFKVFSIALLVLIVSCNTSNERNIIAFSCIYCKGCVLNSHNYISEEQLYLKYKIVLDTTCHNLQGFSFPVHHMESHDIFQRFGRFGNFILIDSTGHSTVFNSDMLLQDYL